MTENPNTPPIPAVKKQQTPPLPVDTWADLRSQMTVDRKCHKPGCFGRGIIGESLDPQGIRRPVLCSCVTFEDNGYILLYRRIDKMEAELAELHRRIMSNQFALFETVRKRFSDLDDTRPMAKIKRLFRKKAANLSIGNDPMNAKNPVEASMAGQDAIPQLAKKPGLILEPLTNE